MTERIQGSTLPVGWGTQPSDAPEWAWSEMIYQGSGLRPFEKPERGGRVVSAHGRTTEFIGGWDLEADHRKRFIIQCWCGRDFGPGTPEMVRNLETITCHREECARVALMKTKRLRRRPRRPTEWIRQHHRGPRA